MTHPSNKYTSRDIKVRAASNQEITVHVPHGITVRRGSKDISVHELSTDDVVRVYGSYDGDGDFDATRIDVIQAYADGY